MTRILALSAVLAATGALPAQELEQPDGARVVRAYFDDRLVAARAVMSLDALESEYEKGYIVLRATDEDIETARQAGMRIVEDDEYVSVALPSEPPADVVEGTIAGFPCYRTVEQTYESARAITRAHPKLASWRWAGRSWKKTRRHPDGHTLYVLRLTNSETPGPKPALFITAALHAREYTTAELALRFAEHLVDSYETDADVRWLLDYQEVHIMMQANPDGRKRAEEGLLWRKNHNTRHCPHSWAGVDLNRNFDFKWGESGSSTNECSTVYRGLSAASEPETQAIQTYMARLFPDARGPGDYAATSSRTSGVVLDIHSHGRLILWPWGHVHDPAPNGTALQTLGRKLAYFNGYTPLQAVGFYPTSGTTDDYGYGVLGRASFTYELGTTFFQGCSRFENSILDDNLESLIYAFKVARTPYRTPAGPDVRNLSLSGGASTTGVAAGTAVTLSATFDDTRYENSNGFEPTQNIAAGEYYVDAPPWARGSTARAMYAADRDFDSRTENAGATIDTTGLSAGQHSVFVRARDSDSNWGAVSAIFLQVAAAQPPPTEDEGSCEPDRETLCLQDSRYAVTVEWRKPDGETGVAGVVAAARTNDSGLLTFFSRNNWEILVKVLDGCALNGHVWVYAASTTDLGYTIRVTDTLTETVKEYENEPGVPAPTITDATAFPDGCRPP
ncbi:MAG: M14 family zinc carboxypeptidase [Acidobacteria bacterium]|nr:M14 family zinc carboxypeptidase [Acidobacteriota bacterium]